MPDEQHQLGRPETFSEYQTQQEELRLRARELDLRERELAGGPVPYDDPRWEQLRAPFEGVEIGKLPKGPPLQRGQSYPWCDTCGSKHPHEGYFHVDYVGHAHVTERLNRVDPSWRLRRSEIQYDDRSMAFMEVELTVLGVTHEDVGCAETGLSEWPKLLYSDCLTRAAMRFGVALDLWKKIKGGGEVRTPGGARSSGASAGAPRSGSGRPSAGKTTGPSLGVLWEDLKNLASTLDAGKAEWEDWKADNDWARVMAANEGKLVESKRQKIEDALRVVREIRVNEKAAAGEEPWDPLEGTGAAPEAIGGESPEPVRDPSADDPDSLEDVDGYGGGYG